MQKIGRNCKNEAICSSGKKKIKNKTKVHSTISSQQQTTLQLPLTIKTPKSDIVKHINAYIHIYLHIHICV